MKNNILKFLSPLVLFVIINIGVLVYWFIECQTANSMLENFFYCPGKEGYALSVILLMWSSISVILAIFLVSLLLNFIVKNRETRWKSVVLKIFLGLGIIAFILPHYIWIAPGTTIFEEYKAQKESNRQYLEQQREVYLNSNEYKELQEKSLQESCVVAKELKLKNPNILIPVDCD